MLSDATTFGLDSRLEGDTLFVGDLSLSRVLLMNDSRYPWLILVPRVAGVAEWHELSESHQQELLTEQIKAATILQASTGAYKMNVAALGNLVRQLHVHVIARFESDQAWPGPVWGVGSGRPYDPPIAQGFIAELRSALGL
jgi:diadenosine tetraphosphate (Ap4A) HIT family hydrolase